MENVHKQSSFTNSCIHPRPSSPPKPFDEHQLETSHQYRQRQRGGGTGGMGITGQQQPHHRSARHDDNDNQGDSVRELESKLGPSLLRQRRRQRLGVGATLDNDDEEEEDLFNLKSNILDDLERENLRFRSMSDFYDSIPDYNDLHHLSEEEFYSRLERLKIQQQELMALVEGSSPTLLHLATRSNRTKCVADEDPRINCDEKTVGPTVDEDCNSSIQFQSPSPRNTRPASKTKKSVRISSGTTTTYRTDFSDFIEEEEQDRLRINVAQPPMRSKSASPRRTSNKLTVPKPFKMTQREEEEKMMEDLANSKQYLSKISINFEDLPPPPETGRRSRINKPFKANPVPLTSKIPLYEHIMEDQRRKSTLAKLNSAIELQSRIKPFKFNGDKSSARCLSRATSQPNLESIGQRSASSTFKANPCPKNLFSNYFYHKMWEDEYFRALNRKIRAEEMLRISNLPPSMAKRNENFLAEFEMNGKSHKGRRKKRRNKKAIKQYEFKDNARISSCSKRSSGQNTNSSVVSSSRETTPIPSSYPVNRPNLAATLRVQSARQKVRDLSKPKSIVPENRITVTPSRSQQPRDGWGVKKSPAWRSMNYDPSNMEDIAIRLATRRAEQRLRQEEHEISMELMKQRVRAAPLLLEGPTFWGPKVGQLSHRCRSTDNVSAERSSKAPTVNRRTRHNSSKLSFYSADNHSTTCGEEKANE